MQLAGHDKDPRLVQVELSIVPNVGDRIREDCNSPDWAHKLPHLIREGEFIESGEYFGATFWKVKLKNGKFAKFHPQDSEIIERAIAPVLVEKEISQSLPEQFKIGDRVDTESCGKNLEIIEINGEWLRCKNKQDQKFFINRKFCSPISTFLEVSELSPLQPETLAKSAQSSTSTSAKTRKKSIKTTSLKSASIPTSETITHREELTSLQEVSPVQEPVLQEVKQDLTTPSLQCGLSTCDVSKKDSPDSLSSKTPQDYSIAEWELSYKAYPKAGTMRNGKLSPLEPLEVPKLEKGCLSLPTLTTGLGSGRNAGATRLEKWLKDKGLVLNIQALNPSMMALLFGFPKDWAECLLESPKESKVETRLEPCLGEQSISIVPPSSSSESSIYIEFSANNIDAVLVESDRYQFLLERREQLINSGASPQGVWINCGKVPNRDFKQAVWKSDKPQPQWGNKKSQYIGKYMGDEHLSAIAQHRAGQELRKIEREIRKLQVKS